MRRRRRKTPPGVRFVRSRRRFPVNPSTIIIIVSAIAALMLLAAVGPLFIPTSASRGWIEEEVAAQLEGRVQFQKIRFQLLPYPGYTITGFGLYSLQEPFRGLPLVTAEKIRGSLSFWHLLGGKVVTSITAQGVTLDYRMTAGNSNLDAMMGLPPGLPPTAAAPATDDRDMTIVGGEELGTAPPAPPSGIPEIKALPSSDAPPVTTPPAQPATPTPAVPPKGPTTPPSAPVPVGPTPLPGTSGFFDGVIVRQAQAGEPPSGGDNALSIRSVRISNGRFNFWRDGAVAIALEGIALEAKHLSFASGFGADLRMSAMASGTTRFPMSLSGQLFIDTPRRELGTRGMRVTISNSQAVADFSVNYGAAPSSFDIHVATPDMGAHAAASFLGLIGQRYPGALTWDGPVAADFSARGTRESYALATQVEAASARFSIGTWWMKGAGLPFKISLDAAITPQAISLQQVGVTLGQQVIGIKGQIERAQDTPLQLSITGTGLDGNSLKIFLPQLALFDVLDGADVTLAISGPLSGEAPLRIGGEFKAKRIAFAGLELAEPEGTFDRLGASPPPPAPAAETSLSPPEADGETREIPAPAPPPLPPSGAADGIVVPTLKGTFAGGTLTGNGQMTIDPSMEFTFGGVVERLDASAIPALAGVMSGEASLVLKATSGGQDASALASRMKLVGSLLIKSGAWKEARLAPQIFSADLWREIESTSQAKLDAPTEEGLAQTGNEFIDLSASFEMTPGTIAISDLSWDQSAFEMKLTAEIGGEKALKGEGTLTITKTSAQALVPAASRSALLDGEGRLAIPVKIGGRLPAFEIVFDREKLAALVKERMAAAPPAKPAKAMPNTAVKAKPKLPPSSDTSAPAGAPAEPAVKPKKPASKKTSDGATAPPARSTPRGKRSAPPSDEQVDDMLKVIIGQ